jgi:hypothetical protein
MAIKPTIKIEDFIFHVVHNGQSGPILLDETPIAGFEDFFIARIEEILEGNTFNFNKDSKFLLDMRELDDHPKKFVAISKELAKRFHNQDRRIKPGVMILMKVLITDKVRYVLIKYDHHAVIYYKTQSNKALLSKVTNTFSENKDALQKSAIIDLKARKSVAVVVDKSDRQNVTDFFKEFLGINRQYDQDTLTTKVRDAFRQTVKAFKDQLPEEITKQTTLKFATAAKNNPSFDPATFIRSAIGADFTPDMEQRFLRELRDQDIAGESFTFQENIPAPTFVKYKSAEGVTIKVPHEAIDTVRMVKEGNRTTLTIVSTRIDEE